MTEIEEGNQNTKIPRLYEQLRMRLIYLLTY